MSRAAGAASAFYLSATDSPGKQRILQTALELFARDGLCETSVRDIARRSGLTNPAMFKHFESKRDLARCLFERCYLALADRISTAAATDGSFDKKQRAVVEAYLTVLIQEPEAVLYVQDGLRQFWRQMPPEVRRRSIVADVRDLLVLGRREGKVTRDVDLDLLTVAWIGTLQQLGRAYYFGEFKQPAATLAAKVAALLTRMVRS